MQGRTRQAETPNAQRPTPNLQLGYQCGRNSDFDIGRSALGVRRFLRSFGQCFCCPRNHSTNFGSPTLNGVVGL
jgi:hypothetical protein